MVLLFRHIELPTPPVASRSPAGPCDRSPATASRRVVKATDRFVACFAGRITKYIHEAAATSEARRVVLSGRIFALC